MPVPSARTWRQVLAALAVPLAAVGCGGSSSSSSGDAALPTSDGPTASSGRRP